MCAVFKWLWCRTTVHRQTALASINYCLRLYVLHACRLYLRRVLCCGCSGKLTLHVAMGVAAEIVRMRKDSFPSPSSCFPGTLWPFRGDGLPLTPLVCLLVCTVQVGMLLPIVVYPWL